MFPGVRIQSQHSGSDLGLVELEIEVRVEEEEEEKGFWRLDWVSVVDEVGERARVRGGFVGVGVGAVGLVLALI